MLEAGLLPAFVGVVGVLPAAGDGAIFLDVLDDCELGLGLCRSGWASRPLIVS